MNIEQKITEMKDLVTEMRRSLHRIPEEGFREYRTAEYIRKKLGDFGIDKYDVWMETGTVAVIEGPKPGITAAFRADMDGLPVNEPVCEGFSSENEGMMHACGHDGHMAGLLGFAKYLMENRENLCGKAVLIFQPAEEGPGGAEPLINAGITEKYGIEKYIGLHIFPEFEQGKIACRPGAMMARNGEVTISIAGRSAHGAQPQQGRDAVLAAAATVMALNTVVSRSVSPLESAVLSFGELKAGTVRNVVAENAVIKGTMRAFSDEVYMTMVKRIEEIAEGTAAAYGCRAETDFNHMYRVVDNEPGLAETVRKAAGEDSFELTPPYMIAEDFSFYQTKADGVFFFLGSRNEEKGFTAPLHSSSFNFDEEILLYGIQTFANILKELNCL